MKYNSIEETLRMPEYGRIVQNMALKAITIEDDDKRQNYAEMIVKIMYKLNGQAKKYLYSEEILWNHLWYITDGKLQVNYHYSIQPLPRTIPPERIAYSNTHIQNKHYGAILEATIAKAMEQSSTDEQLYYIIANRMKRNLSTWKGGNSTDEKVFHDLKTYSNGKISL